MSINYVIDAKNISKTYGSGSSKFQALNNVSLQVARGESVAIVGKSGSGKSTLMHLLALLDKPDSGNLFIEGQDTQKLRAKAANAFRNKTFGFVFQQFFLTPNTSVLDNVVLPLKIAGTSRNVRNSIGLEMLKSLDLDSKAKNKSTALSVGRNNVQ